MTAKSQTGGEPASSSNYAAAPASDTVTDPSALTTDSIRREIGATRESFGLEISNVKTLVAGLKELDETKIGGLKELGEARLDAAMGLCDQKFESVDEKLELVERQRVELKLDTATAVQAALAAAKEAVSAQAEAFKESVNKSETATSKQLDQLGSTFRTEIGNIVTNQGEHKDRMTRMETSQISQTAFDQVVASFRAEITDLKKSRDEASGAAVRTMILVGAFFAAITVALRFVG